MFKHRAPRRAVRRDFRLETPAGALPAVMRNVSATGMLVEAEGFFSPGDRVSFGLMGQRIAARVVSVHRGCVSIAFLKHLSEREIRMLVQG
ncbi:PilZ domain-containing protein [Ovoidimarina sediminis]|uniref:PilZ domain-containing protein n=1 Tax=Ovoidimarina sediminis TaxID=3079856 RepID=UPI002910EE78|nr:PilZ domain-containing protein [Rhodophyticola sp. MJ-SS7]MDU8942901.1 PilZ domain-containing protein [Rhodophyticola sp. MJ-SS7]